MNYDRVISRCIAESAWRRGGGLLVLMEKHKSIERYIRNWTQRHGSLPSGLHYVERIYKNGFMGSHLAVIFPFDRSAQTGTTEMNGMDAKFANWQWPAELGFSERPPRSARHVATVDMFAQTPVNERSNRYCLSSDETRKYWMLWSAYFDDEFEMRWIWSPYAFMPRAGIRGRDAARELLRVGWSAERDLKSLRGPFESIGSEGLLTTEELRELGRYVWRDQGNSSPMVDR